MLRIGRHHEGSWLDRQEVVCPHEPRHSLVVHQQPAPPQFRRDVAIAIPTPMRQRDLLNLHPYGHLFVYGLGLL
jgi:hypothetical protein